MAINASPMTEEQRRRLLEEERRRMEAMLSAGGARTAADQARAQQIALQAPQSAEQGINPLGLLRMMEGDGIGILGAEADPGIQTVSGLPDMSMLSAQAAGLPAPGSLLSGATQIAGPAMAVHAGSNALADSLWGKPRNSLEEISRLFGALPQGLLRLFD